MELDCPTVELRKELWRKLIPKRAPAASDVDHQELAERWVWLGTSEQRGGCGQELAEVGTGC
jgi:hypothetical protein